MYFNQQFLGWETLLHVVDLSAPRQPIELPTFRAWPSRQGRISGAHNPWAKGQRLVWAYYNGGIRVFDTSRPERPVEIGYHTGPYSWGVLLYDDGLIYSKDMFNRRLMVFRFDEPGQRISDASNQPGGHHIWSRAGAKKTCKGLLSAFRHRVNPSGGKGWTLAGHTRACKDSSTRYATGTTKTPKTRHRP